MQCAIDGRRAADVGLLCQAHRDRLADLLNPHQLGDIFVKPGEPRTPPSIPVLYSLLSTQRGRHGLSPVGPPAFGPSSPGDDEAIVLRDPRSTSEVRGRDDRERAAEAPLAVLIRLTLRVVDDRGRPERIPPTTVEGLSSYLHGQVDWIAHQPWVPAAWEQLRALSASLRAAVGDPAPRPVGPCWVLVNEAGFPDPEGTYRCATPLYMPEQPPRAPDEPVQLPAIHCPGCGWHYTGAELLLLGRLVEQQEVAS